MSLAAHPLRKTRTTSASSSALRAQTYLGVRKPPTSDADTVLFSRERLRAPPARESLAAPAPRAVIDTLRSIGIEVTDHELRRLPYRLPWHLPELQARILRDSLECCGARVEVLDLTQAETHP